jgi:UDP-N-acetylmuramoylalanine--D-glutamate ligase
VPVTTEIRLFIERCPCPILGVTGTKGKSTTTAMLGAVLSTRRRAHVGGNIGKSLLDQLNDIQPDHLVVLELSSFMLEYLDEARWSPHVAIVTMIAPDHLDRHGSEAAYLEAKKTIVRHQKPTDLAVLNEECPDCTAFARATPARVLLYGIADRKPFALQVPGRHNQLHAQAAFLAASVFDVTWEEAQAALREFKGLAHRLELVHERDGVKYYNDSIATIPEAAVAALGAFPPKTVIQIVGGYDKRLDLTAMNNALLERAKAVLCIGQTGDAIASALESHTRTGGAAIYRCGDLATALRIARQVAGPGDTVLLSPGCASYDRYQNFEQRGEEFARLARQQ